MVEIELAYKQDRLTEMLPGTARSDINVIGLIGWPRMRMDALLLSGIPFADAWRQLRQEWRDRLEIDNADKPEV